MLKTIQMVIVAGLLTGFLQTPPATAQQGTWSRLSGRTLTEFPPGKEGVTAEGEPWHEDIRRVTEGLNPFHTPEGYREALQSTGMSDHLAGSSLSAPDSRDSWSQRGPIGAFSTAPRNGRISGIQIIDPDNSSPSVFVGSCQGGLWVAQNSGVDGGIWEDIGRLLPNPSVRGFAVDPANDQHIIVGTGDHKRYDGSGMYETYDGGNSWWPKSTPSSPSYYYRVIYQNRPSSPAHQYVMAATSAGLFLSSNRGTTWYSAHYMDGDPTTTGLWTDLLEHPTQPNILYACVSGRLYPELNGVYKSEDYGENWFHLPDTTLPQGNEWGRASLAICRSTPDVLAVLVEGGGLIQGVYKTTDGGGNWTNITGSLAGFGGDQIVHAQAIAIRPTNPNQIFVGAVYLAMSNNGGASWALGEDTGINWGHSDITQLYFSDVLSDDTLWICNDGGVYYHDFNTGGDFSFIGGPVTGLACSEIDFMDADRDVRVIGLQDNGILFSNNHGQSWYFESSGDGADVEIYDPVAGDYMYNAGSYPSEPQWHTFRKPYDSWATYLPSPYPVYMPRLTHQTDTGLMATNDQQSIYAMDAESGTTWNQIITDLQTDEYFIRSVTASQAADGAYYVLYWDYNPGDLTVVREVAGEGWVTTHTENIMGNGQRITSVTPSREWPGEAWVTLAGTAGQGKVMHTTDFGVSWMDLTNQLSSVTVVETIEVQPFNPLVLFVGTNLGMFRSTDGGQNWLPFQTGLPIGRCKELRFVIDPFNVQHTLELAMDGRGLWTMPIASPRIIFVDKDATGPEAGSREHPYHSIGSGIQNAPAGAIVAVRSNTYIEPYIFSGDVQIMTWNGRTLIR